MKRPIESDYTSHVAYARAFEEYCDFLPQLAQEPVETWEDLHNALQRIDTAAVGLPTFEVRHEGGLDAVVQNIVDAIVALHEDRTTPPEAQRTPLTHKEIWSAIRPLTKSDEVCKSLIDVSMDEYRAIEAAHGIKENT